jgi:hypothetical protein
LPYRKSKAAFPKTEVLGKPQAIEEFTAKDVKKAQSSQNFSLSFLPLRSPHKLGVLCGFS